MSKIVHILYFNQFFFRPMNLKSLDVSISGLDYMNDDPTEVNVLYAKVQNPEIQVLANKIQSFFENCGMLYTYFLL